MTDIPRYFDVPFSQNKPTPVEALTNNGIETTTWHDQAPSHPPVSPDIAEMEAVVADAVAYADNLLEKWLRDQTGTIRWDAIDKANEYVVLVQNALYHLRDVRHGNDCTCNPAGGDMCVFCWRERQYKKFMEQCSEGE